jgi:hypothetical protein
MRPQQTTSTTVQYIPEIVVKRGMKVLTELLEYIKEIVTNPSVIVAGAMTLVEFAPIKINPWQKIFGIIGRLINGELIKKVDDMNHELKDLRNVCDERDATLKRTHIFHFNDEILHGIRHTKEHFNQILDDITDYETFCNTHPDYKNDKAVCTIENIRRVYRKCMEESDFL